MVGDFLILYTLLFHKTTNFLQIFAPSKSGASVTFFGLAAVSAAGSAALPASESDRYTRVLSTTVLCSRVITISNLSLAKRCEREKRIGQTITRTYVATLLQCITGLVNSFSVSLD